MQEIKPIDVLIDAAGVVTILGGEIPIATGAANEHLPDVAFDGEGTLANIRGASLLKGSQHADATLVADHAVGGCQNREVFKAVLDERSRGVFQGKIIVRPDAQKTDAKQTNKALLLSDDALALSRAMRRQLSDIPADAAMTELRGRYVDEFPMNSGVFVGNVDAYTLMDANVTYALPFSRGTDVSLSASNLFDDRHREFVGAPELGRMVILRLRQGF